MEEEKFIKKVLKVDQSRIHKITNSYGVYDAYKYYRKNKPKDKKYILTESQYFSIIRKVNEYLREQLCNGEDISLPYGLGKIEIRKHSATFTKDGNKIKTNLPIDWNSTLKLWYEDPKYYEDKFLVRLNEKEIFRVFYNKYFANYRNKGYYRFSPNRELKLGLKHAIKHTNFDAFIR